MHRVDTKKRRATLLRVAAYGLTITLSVVATVVLLFFALGYRLDSKNGKVISSGLMLVDSKPESAHIYLNNELKDNATPGRFVLAAGNYMLTLKEDGYREWSKRVAVKGSGVSEVNYPLLIPNKIISKSLLSVETPTLVSQSLNRQKLLTYVPSQTYLQLTELDTQQPKVTPLNLPSAVRRENGQLGKLVVIEWGLDNKHVLLEQTLPSGSSQLISLDVTKPSEAINISTLYDATLPSNVHYVGDDVTKIYGLTGDTLQKFSLKARQQETVLSNVRSYEPYGDDVILFDRIGSDGQADIGLQKGKQQTVVHRAGAAARPALLRYANFDGDGYFVVAEPTSSRVTIYKNPLKKPILKNQLPLTTYNFTNPERLNFSDSSRFILVQSGNAFVTYDLDQLKKYSVELPFELADSTKLRWLDGYHIQVTDNSNMVRIFDYDGQNQQSLATVLPASQLYFADNYRSAYRYHQTNGKTNLETVSLVAGN